MLEGRKLSRLRCYFKDKTDKFIIKLFPTKTSKTLNIYFPIIPDAMRKLTID